MQCAPVRVMKIRVVESGSIRLDQFLFNQKISPSRSQISRWIKTGNVQVNKKFIKKPSYHPEKGDSISIDIPEKSLPSKLKAENIPLDILYEDDDILVVNKPPHLVVHPGAGHSSGTLTHALLGHCKGLSQIGGVERPGIVHRLDKGTSGLMVVAKNDEAHLNLSKQFKDHEVEKIYWVIVYGVLAKNVGTIKTLIARSDHNRQKFTIHEKRGKNSVTHYQVKKEKAGLSLLEIRLETGRTHQIRVHLSHLGHSIVGDPLYGGHKKLAQQIKDEQLKNEILSLDHTFLHAQRISFSHPKTHKKMEWQADLPADFKRVADILLRVNDHSI